MTLKLSDFVPFRPRPTAPQVFDGLAQVRAYWEGLRRDGAIPTRAALDPRGLAGVLDRVLVAERIGRGLVQVRIAGSTLNEVAGMDLRGLPLSCLFTGEARPILADTLEAVAMGQTLAELDLSTESAGTVARLLLLPLADGPDRRLVLGCLAMADRDIGRIAARRGRLSFGISRRQSELLQPEMARDVAPPRALPARQVGHLTLVHARD